MVAAAVQWAERIMRKIDNGKPEESSLRPLRHGVTNMTVDDFRQSLTATKPPAELTLALLGLSWDAKGDWKRAHESAQQDEGPEGSAQQLSRRYQFQRLFHAGRLRLPRL
jgi:hypothetical protein